MKIDILEKMFSVLEEARVEPGAESGVGPSFQSGIELIRLAMHSQRDPQLYCQE